MSSNLEPQVNSAPAEINHHEVLIEVADLMAHHRNSPERWLNNWARPNPVRQCIHGLRAGNVRELENIIGRSVILSQGPFLTVPLGELSFSPQDCLNNGTPEACGARPLFARCVKPTEC